MYKLRLAKTIDIPELKKIWKLCFDDTNEFIDFFFENIFPHIYPIVLFFNKTAVGMMYLFPISTPKSKGFYVYAIGVHPEFRGKNIFKKHINKPLQDYVKDNNMFCVLSPANEKLSCFYKSLEYTSMCKLYKNKITSNGSISRLEQYTALTSRELYLMRKKHFKDIVLWSQNELELILKLYNFTGGKALHLKNKDCSFYCVAEVSGTAATIIESNINRNEIEILYSDLCEKFGSKSLYLISESGQACNLYADILAYNMDNTKKYYFNFTMQ